MNFCPNCGTKTDDISGECPNCKNTYSKIPPEKNDTESYSNQTSPDSSAQQGSLEKSRYKNSSEYPHDEKIFSNGLKVLFTAISILIPIAGLIFGIIASIILMTRPYKDYKSFGLALLIMNIIILVFFLMCCAISGFSLFGGSLRQDIKEDFFDYIETEKLISVFGIL